MIHLLDFHAVDIFGAGASFSGKDFDPLALTLLVMRYLGQEVLLSQA